MSGDPKPGFLVQAHVRVRGIEGWLDGVVHRVDGPQVSDSLHTCTACRDRCPVFDSQVQVNFEANGKKYRHWFHSHETEEIQTRES
jgi:hypothetical protein